MMRYVIDNGDGTSRVEEDDTPAPVPASLSRAQFFIMLAASGLATPAEALAGARTGAIPPALEPLFAALPEPAQTTARILFATANEFERRHPLMTAAVAAGLITDAALDDHFRAGATAT